MTVSCLIYIDPSSNAKCTHGPRAGPVRHPCGTYKGTWEFVNDRMYVCQPARVPYGFITGSQGVYAAKNCKIPHGCGMCSYVACTGPALAFTGRLSSQNPYGARKLIMHALKLYGSLTGPVSGRTIFAQNSLGNSSGTTCTGPGSVMWLRHDQLLWELDYELWELMLSNNYVATYGD